MKAAYVNKITSIVENIIVVGSLEDPVDDAYMLVKIPYTEIDYTKEENDLYNLLAIIDPDFSFPPKEKMEPTIVIGVTKWNSNDGFYE